MHPLLLFFFLALILPLPAHAQSVPLESKSQSAAEAQAYLDRLEFFDFGPATPKNAGAAVYFWKKQAAQTSDARAFFNLGLAYNRGLGVYKDNVAADGWFTLAAAKGLVGEGGVMPIEVRARLRELMTKEQIDEGVSQAKQWLAQHPLPQPAR